MSELSPSALKVVGFGYISMIKEEGISFPYPMWIEPSAGLRCTRDLQTCPCGRCRMSGWEIVAVYDQRSCLPLEEECSNLHSISL
jgi:hypothetical protein